MGPQEGTQGRAVACLSCGGAMIEGSMAVTVLGSPRFVVRVATTEVATEVAAAMCAACGLIQLRARDPVAIRTARAAAGLGRTPVRWSPFRRAGTPATQPPAPS